MKPKDRKKLVALLGMTGSSEDGEVANAGRMANDFVRSLGLTWENVIISDEEEVRPTRQFYEEDTSSSGLSHTEMAEWLLENKMSMLSTKERSFVEDMLDWRYPTDKQLSWLSKIYQAKGGM